MASLRGMFKISEKFVVDNSPTLLSGLAVVGVVTTAVLTGKASFKAAEVIRDDEFRGGTAGDSKERFKERALLTWKLYIPAVSSGALTIACVVGANRIGTRRAAALAAAYTISEKAFDEYKAKVVEKLGKKKEQEARDELAQERIDRNPSSAVVVVGDGPVLCYDVYSGRYFKSDIETIKKAQNDLNHKIINDISASLNDFYDRLGLDRIGFGEEVGWNSDRLLEIEFSTMMSDDQKPCISITFRVDPIRHYYRLQ